MTKSTFKNSLVESLGQKLFLYNCFLFMIQLLLNDLNLPKNRLSFVNPENVFKQFVANFCKMNSFLLHNLSVRI